MMSDTTFKKKELREALVVLFLGVLILLTPFFISALQPGLFDDDFEAYDLGDLNGQGGWVGSTQYKVVDTKANEGDKSMWIDKSTSHYTIEKEGVVKQTGILSIWIFMSDDRVGSDNQRYFKLLASPSPVPIGTFGLVYKTASSTWEFILQDGITPYPMVIVDYDVSVEEWHLVEVEFNEILWEYRIRLDSGSWSDWKSFMDYYNPEEYDGVEVLHIWIKGVVSWYDTIGGEVEPECELGHCKYCEIYDTCKDAGCYWYYSVYFPKYYCVEPFEFGEEECGSFFKCQYCLTQQDCEIELNCEWRDIGYGDKCYMIEPGMPPEQVEWEAPELEDCGELSGVEKWLCEIKNFIAGIFMPSQEAVSELYETFANFKERFPFNYTGALTSFFTNISNSLDEEKDIPIKILGQESNVDFSFWNTTTTIGGGEETLKNIWFDFTSLVVILGFSVWLISFIRRFFL